MSCSSKCDSCCSHNIWTQPILEPLAAVEDVGGDFLAPSGPSATTVVPHVKADASVVMELWDGVTWTTSPLVIPPGGMYNYWMSFVPPSAVAPIFGSIPAGSLPDAWTNPVLGQTSGLRYPIAGLLAGIPTLKLYSSLVPIGSVILAGTPNLISYNGTYIVVAGIGDAPNTYYLSIYAYNASTSSIVLMKSYTYGIPITSISLVDVDGASAGVSRQHTVLLVTTSRYYLAGEVVTFPAPVVPLSLAPPGDIFLYELPPISNPVYTTPSPSLLFADKYGGFVSASYSRKKNAIFALNETETVISYSTLWQNDGLIMRLAPTSIATPGADGVYVVDAIGYSNLLVYGQDRVVAYSIATAPS